jgi:hypothetical protein
MGWEPAPCVLNGRPILASYSADPVSIDVLCLDVESLGSRIEVQYAMPGTEVVARSIEAVAAFG